MKKELLEKIYRQKIECEDEIDKCLCDEKHYTQKITELGENIMFCEELLDIIIENE